MDNIFNIPEPSPDLYQNIIRRLKRAKRRAIIIKSVLFLLISILASGFMVVGVYLIIEAINQSGFTQIISLIFSDYQILGNYWQNYLLAVLEAAPLLPVAYLLIACFIFLITLKNGLLNLQKLNLKY